MKSFAGAVRLLVLLWSEHFFSLFLSSHNLSHVTRISTKIESLADLRITTSFLIMSATLRVLLELVVFCHYVKRHSAENLCAKNHISVFPQSGLARHLSGTDSTKLRRLCNL